MPGGIIAGAQRDRRAAASCRPKRPKRRPRPAQQAERRRRASDSGGGVPFGADLLADRHRVRVLPMSRLRRGARGRRYRGGGSARRSSCGDRGRDRPVGGGGGGGWGGGGGGSSWGGGGGGGFSGGGGSFGGGGARGAGDARSRFTEDHAPVAAAVAAAEADHRWRDRHDRRASGRTPITTSRCIRRCWRCCWCSRCWRSAPAPLDASSTGCSRRLGRTTDAASWFCVALIADRR